jgi:predicted HTH transcriptional regulator
MKSPGGSIYPYYYKGGEIHCLKYGSKYKNEEKLFELMKEEEVFIFNTNKKLKIWVDMYKTTITNRVLQELTNNVYNLKDHIDKLSFVGLSGINTWRLRIRIKNLGMDKRISFYSDPEDAKTWLINE